MAEFKDNLTTQAGTPAARGSKIPPTPVIPGAKRVRIIIDDNPDIPPTGLFIGHNGNTFMIQSSKEVLAPAPLLEILDNAITMVPIIDGYTQRIVGHRSRPRFSYRIIRDRDEAA